MNTLNKTAFIFDVDGTLVITESIYADLITKFLKTYGIKISQDYYYENFSGKSFHLVFEHANKILSNENKAPINIPQAIQIIDRIYFDTIQQKGIQSTDGSLELVQRLAKNNIQRAIGSNAPLETIYKNLTASSHIQHFDSNNIFSAYQFQEWKPIPTVYQAAHLSLDTSRINRLVILEDSISGLQAIDNLQVVLPEIEVIGVFVDNGHNSMLKKSLPKTIKHEVTNLYDILEII
jgi:beta-phosphoglucomutase-like phosphatase (HAD superfamily)